MIIDEQLPTYDVVVTEHLVVDADPPTTLEAARQLDLLTVSTPLLEGAMWIRGLPDRMRHRARARSVPLRLAEGVGLPGWLSLGEREGSEVAFGAVGTFWQSSIRWRDVSLADFAGFHEPGWGKIACNFTVLPYGEGRTLLTYECRTATTDEASRRKFARYWWLVRPAAAYVMRAALATIANNATRSPADQPMERHTHLPPTRMAPHA